jgi:hypothetical protein
MGPLETELSEATQLSTTGGTLSEKAAALKLGDYSPELGFVLGEVIVPSIAMLRDAILRLAREIDDLRVLTNDQ